MNPAGMNFSTAFLPARHAASVANAANGFRSMAQITADMPDYIPDDEDDDESGPPWDCDGQYPIETPDGPEYPLY